MKTYTHTQEDIMAAKSLKLVIKDGAKNVEQLQKFQKIAKITSKDSDKEIARVLEDVKNKLNCLV